MPYWKRFLLSLYVHGTMPARRWYYRRTAAAGTAPLAILVFHRIADDCGVDWTMPTAEFVKAIRWLRARCELVSLAEIQRRLRDGVSRSPAVAITFDDGYADNCRTALPLLIEQRIPCTYFVSAGPILTGTPFEHDVRAGQRYAPNTVAELRALSRAGIEIGAHTRTHADLGRVVSREHLVDELVTARDELQAAIGQRIRYFAFPFGGHENLTSEAFALAREAGYDAVCSAYGGYNVPGDDPFHLQRRCIDGPAIRVKNWATFDFLREFRIPRFTPDDFVSRPVAALTPPASAH